MPFRIRDFDAESQFSQAVTADVIDQIIPLSKVRQIIEEEKVKEQRSRQFPALFTALLVIMMNLHTEVSQHSVLIQTVEGIRRLYDLGVEQLGSKSGISHARQRLGVKVMERIFKSQCSPLATRETLGAYAFGLHMVAIDGTTEDVPDTPANRAYFGGPRNQSGDGAYPQVKCVHLCEIGTHAILDSTFWPYAVSEHTGAHRVIRSVQAGDLVFMDAGLYSYDLVYAIKERSAQTLSRLPGTVKPKKVRDLSDGSYLAHIFPSQRSKHYQCAKPILVRIIEYAIDDPNRPSQYDVHRLVTTLVNETLYPVIQLIELYHERWEIEITIDEIDTHQRLSQKPLRSRTPQGVIQELYGLLVAHYIVRAIMHQAAVAHHIEPDRLSFSESIRLIKAAAPWFQIASPDQQDSLWTRLLSDIVCFQLPPREGRINPRVVKRQQRKFNRKRPQHLKPPKPKPFRESIVISGAIA